METIPRKVSQDRVLDPDDAVGSASFRTLADTSENERALLVLGGMPNQFDLGSLLGVCGVDLSAGLFQVFGKPGWNKHFRDASLFQPGQLSHHRAGKSGLVGGRVVLILG